MTSDVMRSAHVRSCPGGAFTTTRQVHSNTNIDHRLYYHSTPPKQSAMSGSMATFRSYPYSQNASLSGSQDSITSITSNLVATSARSRMASSSNNSQITLDTDLTSPTSPKSTISMKDSTLEHATSPTRPIDHQSQPNGHQLHSHNRMRTPEEQSNASKRPGDAASPMSITTPRNGVKRTADGLTKNGITSNNSSPADAARSDRQRAESVSSSSSKAGEAAAQLKTRLAYAMAKVQHGWEHKSMAEVEKLAIAMSPRSMLSSPRNGRLGLVSPGSAMNGQRTAPQHLPRAQIPLQDPSKQYGSPMSPPAKRRSGAYDSIMPEYRPPPQPHHTARPALAPPVEIGGHKHNRRVSFDQSSRTQHRGNSVSPKYTPSTPKGNRRPASIRTSTQTAQDEQDAMQALMLMGSPSNGGQFPKGSQQSSGQTSPLAKASAPRQALQYRSDSYDSVSRSSEGALSSVDSSDRRAILEQIEAE